MPNQNLNLCQDSQYTIVINKNKTLLSNITAQYISGTTTGDTYVDFDFSSYTGATLQVRIKPDAPFLVLQFSTTDGSIVLPASGGTFQLKKSAVELSTVRAGQYFYNMDLHSATYPKRAFLSGEFIIIPNVTT